MPNRGTTTRYHIKLLQYRNFIGFCYCSSGIICHSFMTSCPEHISKFRIENGNLIKRTLPPMERCRKRNSHSVCEKREIQEKTTSTHRCRQRNGYSVCENREIQGKATSTHRCRQRNGQSVCDSWEIQGKIGATHRCRQRNCQSVCDSR